MSLTDPLLTCRDTLSRKEQKESFYPGILLGHMENWIVKSNAESGIGYSDILVEIPKNRVGVVIEMKDGIACFKKDCKVVIGES